MEEDPRVTYTEMKEGLEYKIHLMIDVVDHLDRGLNQNLLSDPEWYKQLIDLGQNMLLDQQLEVQMLPDEEKIQLRKLMTPDES